MYEPNQIQIPTGAVYYLGTLQGAEYEIIAQQNILASQQTGRWIPLEIPEDVVITDTLRKLEKIVDDRRTLGRSKNFIEELNFQFMRNLGFLSKKEDGWYLSEEAIARIAEKYPAQPQDGDH